MTTQREPAFVCTYGRSGIGKTTDNLYSFPNALYLASPGALKPAATVVGYAPRTTTKEAASVMEVTELVANNGEKLRKDFDALVIDDFSFLVERTFGMLEKRFKNFDLWAELRDRLIAFRDTMRRVGMHVLVNAHEATAETKPNGKWIIGGPRLPGQMQQDFPPATDVCLRAVGANTLGGGAADRMGWKGVYRCYAPDDGDGHAWATKDRHGVTPDNSPMNIGEILRLAGYTIRRHKGLEWQEEVVSKVSQLLLANDKTVTQQILQAATARIRERFSNDPLHIRWTLRDAVDRAHLVRARASVLGAFGVY